MSSLRDHATFYRQFRDRFKTTGAAGGPAVRVLEIGPGTGALTRAILPLLRADDRFDLVELNAVFADHLRDVLATSPAAGRLAAEPIVHSAALQDFAADEPYDFVVSSLPLNNFPAAAVDAVCAAYVRLLAPGGELTYFEYMFVRAVRLRMASSSERARLQRVDRTIRDLVARFGVRRDGVLANVPPAWVQHLRRAAA